MSTIVLTNRYDDEPLKIIKSQVPEGFELLTLDKADKDSLMQIAHKADYFLASGRVKIDDEILSRAKNLKMIQRTGVGTDSLDFDSIKKRGVPVYVNQGVNSSSVAEHTILLMLALSRNLVKVDSRVRKGIWEKQKTGVRTHEIFNKTIGLIGMGNIGKKVARLLRPFNVNILYYDAFRLSELDESELGVTFCEFDRLIERVDILSFHCALNENTRYMLNINNVSTLKRGVFIVNTSRGGLIEEDALIKGLDEGIICGVGLDVYENEPVADNSRLFSYDSVILTPHIAGVTYESFHNMMCGAMKNIESFENGDIETIKEKRIV